MVQGHASLLEMAHTREERSSESAHPRLEAEAVLDPEAVLSPFKVEEWRRLTPAERLDRAWALRERLVNPRDVHDRKLFPAP